MAADAVVSDSYEEASRKLRNLAGVKVPATTLRRWTRNICEDAQRFEREAVSEFNRSGAEPIRNKSYAQHRIILPFNRASRCAGARRRA